MPTTLTGQPAVVKDLVGELRELSGYYGLSAVKVQRCPALLRLAQSAPLGHAGGDVVASAKALLLQAIDLVTIDRDRLIILAGFNFAGTSSRSSTTRIYDLATDLEGTVDAIDGDTADKRFRTPLMIEVATNLVRLAAQPRLGTLQDEENLALQLVDTGRLMEARTVLLRAMGNTAEESKTARVLGNLIWVLVCSGEHQSALAYLATHLPGIRRSEAISAIVHNVTRSAFQLTDLHEYEGAARLVTLVLNSAPNNGDLWYRLGCIRWYEEQYVEALAALAAAEQFGVPRDKVLHARGQILAEQGFYEDGLQALDESLARERTILGRAYAQSCRGFILARLGNIEHALAEFEAAASVTPENAWLHYFRGICYAENGMREHAISELQQSLELKAPRLTSGKRSRASLLLEQLQEVQE